MEVITEFFSKLGNLEELIKWGGLTVLIIIIFAETGLLIGFFLPGDSLLITAGLIAAQGYLDITVLNLSLIIAAIAGDQVGYLFGKKTGPKLFNREKSLLFNKDHLIKAKHFYEKYGGRAIIYARFVPFARTFAPIVAGIGDMNYRKFISYNIFGGIFWVLSMTLLGYFFGNIPFVKKNFEFVIIGVIVLSVLPVVIGYLKHRKESKLNAEEMEV
ncbi:MAG: VTT domain-containing protein [Ignavibacteria bacterium]|nr:VTT domain-containing protein [Ignavibacteria bacterium]MBK6773992.1 VTT domain-containing protein [Ignavibacteria bacterium]MBK7255698.1 VTT domain-containing protein [Ignavibacteria bacterium]MBK7447681.1 VTT domain-containing protein [Ignavibacteria bacterium]MBK8382069.1 VTT domain-containing protein [Ignavibacteria bacterium]